MRRNMTVLMNMVVIETHDEHTYIYIYIVSYDSNSSP